MVLVHLEHGRGRQHLFDIVGVLESAIGSFPDERKGKYKHYSMMDAALSGLSVFFMQCPSFLSTMMKV